MNKKNQQSRARYGTNRMKKPRDRVELKIRVRGGMERLMDKKNERPSENYNRLGLDARQTD